MTGKIFSYHRNRASRESDFPDPQHVRYHAPSQQDVARAERWLFKLLQAGEVYQFEIKHLAEAAGISGSLLSAARKSLGVRAINKNDTNPAASWKCWFWALPKPTGIFADQDDD